MDVSEAVQRRASIRAFKPDVPPAAMVRAILEGAARAPSGGNLQPWHVHALTGKPLAQLLHAVENAPLQEAPGAFAMPSSSTRALASRARTRPRACARWRRTPPFSARQSVSS
jgi:nitroreductase